ncbi:MAG: hypothetical protein PQJ49_14460 [Sphaerochaetaceae bacterium]|nr:hypothetical protein [Sphaerochaetaceae bacterium]
MRSTQISMIKEIIRLKFELNLSTHAIAKSVGCSKSYHANILIICRIHDLTYDSLANIMIMNYNNYFSLRN